MMTNTHSVSLLRPDGTCLGDHKAPGATLITGPALNCAASFARARMFVGGGELLLSRTFSQSLRHQQLRVKAKSFSLLLFCDLIIQFQGRKVSLLASLLKLGPFFRT